MKLGYIISLASKNLRNRKLRSFLTIGGMVIGIGAIVFLVSLGFGLQRLIKDRVTNIEALTILEVTTGESLLLKIDKKATDEFKSISNVIDVSPSLSLSGQAIYQSSGTDIAVFGINPAYAAIEGTRMVNAGRALNDDATDEALLTSTALELLGINNKQDILGETIRIKVFVPDPESETGGQISEDVSVEVVGVIDDDELSIAYVPLSMIEPFGVIEYDMAKVKVTERSKLDDVRVRIETEGYRVDSLADTVGQIDQIFFVFQAIMAAFGLIAMFVASLGAFNTLTVSLLERTREVGIMKALGSTRKDIYRLFLAESWVISITGGVLGILVGWGGGFLSNIGLNYLANRFGGEPVDIFYTPWLFVIFMITISLAIGFITGAYPANRASKLNPLDALRYE
ncbi:ABC transporter permease [Patescibacteria group bacterium]|nr:ABC transporter permease [Patescibacteria group bacterium]MBU1890983.1 ABC transporter permease [Patescibacteria group bacterium]